jgi:hypothetical protein
VKLAILSRLIGARLGLEFAMFGEPMGELQLAAIPRRPVVPMAVRR